MSNASNLADSATKTIIVATDVQALSNKSITGSTIDSSVIGGTTAAAGSFTTLSASSTVTLGAGTSGGLLYLNGSKQVTSGSGLTFDGSTFGLNSAGGGAINNSTAHLFIQAPIAGGAGFIFRDTSAGSYAEYMRLTSTGLGIGTSSPVVKFQVKDGANYNFWVRQNSSTIQLAAATDAFVTTVPMAFSAGSYSWAVNNGTNALNLDTSGNLGLGVTPSGWYSGAGFKIFQIGTTGALQGGFSNLRLLQNTYYNSVGSPIYLTTGYATEYLQNSGQHIWQTAPSGTAGASISFTQAMTLDASGNLLVGTTSAFGKLSIRVDGTTTPTTGPNISPASVNLYSGSNSTSTDCTTGIFGWNTTDPGIGSGIGFTRENSGNWGTQIRFYVHPTTTSNITSITEAMRIDSSGNVGIGTNSPLTKLHISNTYSSGSQVGIPSLTIETRQPGAYLGSSAISWKWTDYGNAVNWETGRIWSEGTDWSASPAPGGAIVFATKAVGAYTTTPVERMRIDSAGNLLVGTTSIGAYTAGMLIGNSTSGKAVSLAVNGGGGTYNGVDTVNNPTAGFTMGHITTTSKLQMRVGATGGVEMAGGATSWSAISDERLKDIIEPIKNAAEKVSTLRAVIGKYKTDKEGKRRSFLIAQDVQAVFPEAVNTTKLVMDATDEYLTVAYTDTIPLLVAAIKELKAELDASKAEIAALQAKVGI